MGNVSHQKIDPRFAKVIYVGFEGYLIARTLTIPNINNSVDRPKIN
jgi:hypothetical protein